jgi:hypothetical protein
VTGAAVTVPVLAASTTASAAIAGEPANTEDPSATNAPKAKPLRVKFLDMISLMFSWFSR